MHKVTKRFVAVLCGIATLVGPTTALAEGGDCKTYFQVESTATGGQFVGGLLTATSQRAITEADQYSLLLTSDAAAKIFGTGATVGTTATHTKTYTETNTYDVGHYTMNDGSKWEVNCDKGTAVRVS